MRYLPLLRQVVVMPFSFVDLRRIWGLIGFEFMPTLQESIETLDRFVQDGADMPKTRSQIAFIGREIAALEADYARAIEDNTKLREENTKIKEAYSKQNNEAWDAMKKESEEADRIIQSGLLKH
jgi:Zn-dependent oligopeptidase